MIKYIVFWAELERGFVTDEELFTFIRSLPHNAEIKITVMRESGSPDVLY